MKKNSKVASIGIFEFSDGKKAAPILQRYVKALRRQKGCAACFFASSLDNRNKCFVFSQWDSIKSHDAMIQKMQEDSKARDDFFSLMKMLSREPVFGIYRIE